MSSSPYENLPDEAFWSTGVAQRSPFDATKLYNPKFVISRKANFATAGSCFAQHIGRSLRSADLNVIDAEPLPPGLPEHAANRIGYGLYSARYGNIYSVRQLLQLLQEAFEDRAPVQAIWEKDRRYYDAMRPGLEPEGLPSSSDVKTHRKSHLDAVRTVIKKMDIFVFTLGLTEAWVGLEDETVYPTCPGTIAGRFDPELFEFKNFKFNEIMADFLALRRLIRSINPSVKFILTVSPVPLTATASGRHVEVATCYSKSVLRAVCGTLFDRFADVDYFPSFEIINSATTRGIFFKSNLRSVSSEGVKTAMETFMAAHNLELSPRRSRALRAKKDMKEKIRTGEKSEQDFCEDALLQAFSR